jgi:hypothetical protein
VRILIEPVGEDNIRLSGTDLDVTIDLTWAHCRTGSGSHRMRTSIFCIEFSVLAIGKEVARRIRSLPFPVPHALRHLIGSIRL